MKASGVEYYNNILCVTYADLEQVMPFNTICSIVKNHKCTVLRPGYGRDTYALIQWSSLPDKYQEKFLRLVGDPAQLIRQAERERKVETMHDGDAVDYFSRYEYDKDGRNVALDDGKRLEYIMNYTALKLLWHEHCDRIRLTKASNNTRRDLWQVLHKSCEKLREQYPHTLPKSVDRLRLKVTDYSVYLREHPECPYPFVISGKLGNTNALKLTDAGRDLLIALRRQRVPYVLTMEEIWIQYNAKAEERGWAPLKSADTLSKWYERPEVKPRWFDAVYGEQKAHQKFDRKHTTQLPLLRDQIWYGDGTKLNLYYRTADGKVSTLMVYEVIDASTEMLLGYHISESEDYEAQYCAFRMAVETAGHKPVEIVYDNQGGHKKLASQHFFSKLCLRHRPTAPYNGSSKTIEHAFYRFQSSVLAKYFNFTGQNVTAKMDKSKPNIEFIEANKASLPTLEELKKQYAQAREAWNSSKHPTSDMSRRALYESQINPNSPSVSQYDIIDMFWLTTQRPSSYNANGIKITIKGIEYLYEVYAAAGLPDFAWTSENIDRKFYVMYDPLNMTSVRLMSGEEDPKDRRFVRVAGTKMVVHRSSAEQTAEERQFIRATNAAIQAERARRVTEGRLTEIAHGVAPEQHGMNSPEPKNLPKELREQMEQKLASARRKKVQEDGLGTYTKFVSLQDWEEADSMTDKDNIRSKY